MVFITKILVVSTLAVIFIANVVVPFEPFFRGLGVLLESYSASLSLIPTRGLGGNNQVRWIIEDN